MSRRDVEGGDRGVIAQRDAIAVAAKEYLMRSVPDPGVGADAEDTLREILADLIVQEREEGASHE